MASKYDLKDVKGLEDTIIDPTQVVVFIDEKDAKRSSTYNLSVLDIIPVYKMIYTESKEYKFTLATKYYNIIDNIIQLYVNNITTFKISAIDCIVMLDFIHKYMVVKNIYTEFINNNKFCIQNEFNNKNYQYINTLVTEAEKYLENPEIIKIIDSIINELITNSFKLKTITNDQWYQVRHGHRTPDVESYKCIEEVDIYFRTENDLGCTYDIKPTHTLKVCMLTADDLSNIHVRYHHIIFKLLLQ